MSARKILLVEDNTDDVLLTLRALQRANILNEVVVTRDGHEAFEYLAAKGQYAGRDASDYPVVVLLDLKMPRMGGLEFLRRIRSMSALRLLPVVILTSSKVFARAIISVQIAISRNLWISTSLFKQYELSDSTGLF